MEEGGPVGGHVVEVARAGRGLVLAPAPRGLRPVEEALAAEMAQLAELAVLAELGQVAQRRREAVGEGCHAAEARSAER